MHRRPRPGRGVPAPGVRSATTADLDEWWPVGTSAQPNSASTSARAVPATARSAVGARRNHRRSCKNGVMTLRLPKVEAVQPKQIKVRGHVD